MFLHKLRGRSQLNRCIRLATSRHPAGDIRTGYHQDGGPIRPTDWAYRRITPCSELWAEQGCHLRTDRQRCYLVMRIRLKYEEQRKINTCIRKDLSDILLELIEN